MADELVHQRTEVRDGKVCDVLLHRGEDACLEFAIPRLNELACAAVAAAGGADSLMSLSDFADAVAKSLEMDLEFYEMTMDNLEKFTENKLSDKCRKASECRYVRGCDAGHIHLAAPCQIDNDRLALKVRL